MDDWLITVGVAAVSLVCCYLLLIVLARRLPAGPLRDLVRLIPDCVSTMRALHRDPRVPRRAKAVLWFALIWAVSPIDLIPEFLPVIGPLDDIVVIALALRYVIRVSPREAVEEAWPGRPALLDRLVR